jgi:hypothetical protein
MMSATSADPEVMFASVRAGTRASVPASSVAGLLLGLLVLQQILLWRFLGFSHWWFGAAAVAALATGCAAFRRSISWPNDFEIDLRLIAISFAVSLLLFALGGEGRFFFQTADWQVRNAVLHDLVTYPWPFAYQAGGQVELLRAPLGLYLLPALVGKLGGLRCAEVALWAQSAVLLALILSLASGLFEQNSKRLVGLLLFVGFSGMDVVGTWLLGRRLDAHLEWWSDVQFSSTATLAYWVPMHALAGWLGAVLYLLWRTERVPLFAFLSFLPLIALLSPLALIGIMPFAALAGISALWSRSLRFADVAVPFGTLLLSIPSLLYVVAASSAVGPHLNLLTIPKWALFEMVEVVPYLLAIVGTGRPSRFGQATVAVTSLVLLFLPWAQLGSGPDIPMRASIPALAILSVMVADLVVSDQKDRRTRLCRAVALIVFFVGSVTPLSETWRAIHRPRQALGACGYYDVVPGGSPTYVAPLHRVSPAIAPSSPTLVRPTGIPSCREVDWRDVELRYVGRNARSGLRGS